jgi:hypothetical protein
MRIQTPSYIHYLKTGLAYLPHKLRIFWHRNWLSKTIVVFVTTVVFVMAGMYGIARWYITSEQHTPLVMGTSFIPAYAESLGLNPQETMDALIDDVGVKHFRLVSYWDQLEPTKGTYDFSLLDWQFKKAEAAHAKVTLSLGLRQPRWPECHMPSWAAGEPQTSWQPQLENFIAATVGRYKNSPALDSYQLENEYFLKGFGTCTNWDRSRLVSEYSIVKHNDQRHTVIVTRSNNAIGWPAGDPKPDEYGISIYKRVWSPVTRNYFEYPFPAWYYAFVAGWQKLVTGNDMIIHELQAEAWTPHGQNMVDTPLEEQNKSFDAARFKSRVAYGKGTGMREIYLWGGEYWYYRKAVLHDSTMWDAAKETFNTQLCTQ